MMKTVSSLEEGRAIELVMITTKNLYLLHKSLYI